MIVLIAFEFNLFASFKIMNAITFK